ncbi:unnamed protein product [Linum trigynum]|uniref:Integrase catalytic domain-containing protein n=1 Tax=Linum trigynum TaxID=586398 RepID=A0AAV2C6G3_9ROSI
MSSDRPSVRLTSTNFALWEFQFRVFVEGRGMLGILDGTTPEPRPTFPASEIDQWNQRDARVRSWLLDCVDPSTCLSLRQFTTSHAMMQHLKATYSTVNIARQFEVQMALARLEQGDQSVTDYFNAAQELWTEQDIIAAALRPQSISADALAERRQNILMGFLMRLRPEFETVRSTLLNQADLKFDGMLGVLIREETRMRTQAQLDVRPGAGETIFAASQGSAYAADRLQFQRRTPVSELECHHCHERGHLKKHCRGWNFCVYCKRTGHIVLDCRTRQRHEARVTGGMAAAPPGRNPPATGSSSRPYNGPSDRPYNGHAERPYNRPVDRSYNSHSDRPAYLTAASSSGSGSLSASDVEQMVNAALQRSLPTAINAAFATLHGSIGKKPPWLLDSACFNHMTHDSSCLTNLEPVRDLSLRVANGNQLQVKGVGIMNDSKLNLPHTLHVPHLVPNLVSVGQLTEEGCSVLFAPSGCFIQDLKTGRQIGKGSKRGRIFHLEEFRGDSSSSPISSSLDRSVHSPVSCFSSQSNNAWDLWHSRLEHPHSSRLAMMFKQSLLGKNTVSIPAQHSCTSCVEAKTVSRSFPSSDTVIDQPFHLIHTDLWGPSTVISRHGFRYFALFIDHATRFTWVYFLRLKSELRSVATEFLKMINTQFDRPVKIVRSDPGGEFSSIPLHEVYRALGILSQKSCPGVSQQNGLVERKNRHVLDLTRALLLASNVPSRFWPEAVATAVRLINYQITPILHNVSPFYALYHKHPDYSRLRVFGSLCFVLLPRRERTKLSSKTARCVFLGYSDVHKGYLCFDNSSQRMRIATTVIFFEHIMFHSCPSSTPSFLPSNLPLPLFGHDDDDCPDPTADPPTPPTPHLSPSVTHTTASSSSFSSPSLASSSAQETSPATSASPPSSASSSSSSPLHSSATASPPAAPQRRSTRLTQGVPPPKFNDYFAYGVDSYIVPTRYKQAHGDPVWDYAMKRELDALHANNTWTLVPRPPPSTSVIGCRWVYTIKMNPDGTIERHKARLVAQGFTQELGVDYNETFAPVAKMSTVRTLLAVASRQQWPLYQLDVKNAFLHGDLAEEIYMECPPGYSMGTADQVCRLNRSLYGLKQAPRAWFEKFQSTIRDLGCQQSLNDPSLFTRKTAAGLVALLLYVDDMVITGSDPAGIRSLKEGLNAAFNLKDLGDLSYFLGLEVTRNSKGLLLSQRKYISDLLSDHRFQDCKPVSTPMESNLRLGRTSGALLQDVAGYRSIVGSLIYLAATRPDISYAVQIVSQFMASPRTDHLAAVHRILRYLQGTRDVGMFFPSTGSFALSAYSDSDFAGCVDTRRSTTGWSVQFGSAFISWRCKKQDKVSKSSTEAEYRAMSDVASELVWLRRLLRDLGVICSLPMVLYVDNTSAIRIAVNPVLHDRTKHIEIHVHYIRDLVGDGTITLHYVRTEDQIADIFTKAFSTSRHWYLSSKLMLCDQHQFGGGC